MRNPEHLAVRKSCTRFLNRDAPKSPRKVLRELSDYAAADLEADWYGEGALLEALEGRVATLLGKPAAVFMPSGKMGQNYALRLWCDRRGHDTLALHPRCHIEEHEAKAYRAVHGLQAIAAGDPQRVTTLADLEAIAEPIGAISLEMPLRDLGCRLNDWDELGAMAAWARRRAIPFHLDGARIWESQPFYGRPLAEIAALFDSVYVSFYKGLGGIAGGAVAGPADLIEALRLWLRRAGGRLIHVFPMALSAMKGLDERLPLMAAFHDKAKAIAEALAQLPGLRIAPEPPQANAMQVTLETDVEDIMPAAVAVARETGLWLFDRPLSCPIPGLAQFEITVRGATLELSDDEIVAAVESLKRHLVAGPGQP